MSRFNIGCSGFSYKHWKEVFYPNDLSPGAWLQYYTRSFSTVELNVTFYHLPSRAAFLSWHRATPPGFIFAVKGSRFITHIKRLADAEEPLARFFEGTTLLKEKLKVVLWQLPPTSAVNLERFSSFLKLLKKYPLRHAFEFRHESWITPKVVDLCAEHNVCLCMADSPAFLQDLPVTADFVYIRRHGKTASHAGRYSKAQLAQDAVRIRIYGGQEKDIFVYFNNDPHGYAPLNARELIDLLKEDGRRIEKPRMKS
jgi:uncharacterized protein YecE (DUF72 family)